MSLPLHAVFPPSACQVLLQLTSTLQASPNCLSPPLLPSVPSVSHWKRKEELKGEVGMINSFLLWLSPCLFLPPAKVLEPETCIQR